MSVQFKFEDGRSVGVRFWGGATRGMGFKWSVDPADVVEAGMVVSEREGRMSPEEFFTLIANVDFHEHIHGYGNRRGTDEAVKV